MTLAKRRSQTRQVHKEATPNQEDSTLSSAKKMLDFFKVIQIFTACGIIAVFMSIGEYKERIKNIQETIQLIKLSADVQASENKGEHKEIQKRVSNVEMSIIDHTGKAIR